MRLALLIVLAACGSGGAQPDAASLDDAGVDGGLPDAPLPDARTVATVKVELDGSPKSGALVVFHAASGDATEPVTTDATGVASGELAPGSTISVGVFEQVDVGVVNYRLISIHAAQPEDILVTLDDPGPPAANLGSVNLTLSAPGVATADVYGCGNRRPTSISTAGPTAFAINEGCLDADGKLGFFAVGFDGTGAAAGFASLKGLAPVPGSTYGFATAFSAGTSTTRTYTNGFSIGSQVEGRASAAHVIAGRLFYQQAGTPVTAPPPITFGLGPAAEGHAVVDGMVSVGTLDFDPATIGSYSRSYDVVIAPPQATVDVDAPTGFLAGISGRAATRPAVGQLVASWTPGATGIPLAEANGALIHTTWKRGGSSVNWTAVVPASVTSVAFPRLPDAMAGWRPTDTDTETEQLRVTFVQSSLATATSFRRHISTTLAPDTRPAFSPNQVPPALILRISDAANEPVPQKRR